jgi:hypothetical protein
MFAVRLSCILLLLFVVILLRAPAAALGFCWLGICYSFFLIAPSVFGTKRSRLRTKRSRAALLHKNPYGQYRVGGIAGADFSTYAGMHGMFPQCAHLSSRSR